MPDVEQSEARRGGRFLTVLFWTGVGLAPLAGLILLLGGGGTSVRVAAVLAVLAVVLIGLSITLRPDGAELRGEMEDMLLDEIDMLREDVREDITSAARQTHASLAERVQQLQHTVDSLRAELEAARSGVGLGAAPAGPPPPPPPPVASATAAVPPPNAARAAGPPPDDAGVAARGRASAAGRAHVPTGVVRHTETVHHVTTRSTYVGHHGDEQERGTAYHGGYDNNRAEPDPRERWTVPAPRRPSDGPEEESWTDQKLRERYGRRSRVGEREEPEGADPWSGRGGRRRRWSDDEVGATSGEVLDNGPESGRWASRRADERGEELRLGERRAAMRNSESGTEMRIEDRWAAVRRNWDRDAPRAEERGRWDRGEPDGWDREAPAPGWDSPASTGRRERRALPAASDEPSWNSGWDEPEREHRGRRHRPDEEPGNAPGPRRFEFELSDERWR